MASHSHEDVSDGFLELGGSRPFFKNIIGVHVPGEHPLYSVVFYVRARFYCINCDGEEADVEEWMLYREGEPSQAQIAREIGVKPQTIAPVLRKVRRDAPTADDIAAVAKERWLQRGYARVRWKYTIA